MKKSRFSEEKMVKILREADKSPVSRVAKKYSVSCRQGAATNRRLKQTYSCRERGSAATSRPHSRLGTWPEKGAPIDMDVW